MSTGERSRLRVRALVRLLFGGLLFGGLLFGGDVRPVRADPGLDLRVAVVAAEGWASCPVAAEFLMALSRALPPTDRLIESGDATSEVLLRDLGAEFVVQVAGQRRRFGDPLRTCAERARVAAVFASLALHPPGLWGLPPPGLVPMSRKRRLVASLDAAGIVGVAAGGTEPMLTAGGSLRLFLGSTRIGASLGFSGLAPQQQRTDSGVASALVLPVDLNLRLRLARPRVELTGELGVILAALRISAAADADPSGARSAFIPGAPVWRFDAGLRGGLDLRFPVSAYVAPLIGVDVWVWPRPYQLVIEPQGVIAERPLVSVVGRLGLSVRIR